MVDFSKFKIAGFIISLLFINGVINNLDAQDKPESAKAAEPVTYFPIHKFPSAIQHVYMFTDSTEVTRTMPDSSKVKYFRALTYFFTVTQNESPKDGFVTVEVTIDSTRYYIKEGKAEIYWDSQDESAGGINMTDLMYATVPLGKYYNMTYSPYGEVAKISGEKLDEYFDYLNKNFQNTTDDFTKFIWYDGASLTRLANISNVRKINFPEKKVEMDSVWKTPFGMQFDFINFMDTVSARIVDVANGETTIEAISTSTDVLPGNYIFYGIKEKLLPVNKATGNGKYRISLSPRGAVRRASADFDLKLEIPVQREVFSISVKSKVNWTMMGQFKQ
jgi:hypothetical protein